MKRAIIFKPLIDLLFIGLCFGFVSLIFVMPFGLTMIAQESKEIYNWDLFSWVIFILSFSGYILLVLGIKQLRNVARNILKVKNLNETTPKFLKKSGNFLIISSLLNYLIYITVFIKQLFNIGKLEISLDNNFLLQMMITIIGLFFLIQSDILLHAADLKKENDLTI